MLVLLVQRRRGIEDWRTWAVTQRERKVHKEGAL